MLPYPIWNPTPLAVSPPAVPYPGDDSPWYRDPGQGTPVAGIEWNLTFQLVAGPGNAEPSEAQLRLNVLDSGTCQLSPQLEVRWSFAGVYDLFLVDFFEDRPCDAFVYTDPLGRVDFLGGAGTVQAKTESSEEAGVPVTVRALTNILSPAGKGGDALFRNAYLQLEAESPGAVKLTPIVDDVPIPSAARTVIMNGSRSNPQFGEFEIPLLDLSQWSSAAPRGSWIRFELCAANLYDCGRFSIAGLELEYENVRLGAQYRTFGEVPVSPNLIQPELFDFFGFAGKVGLYSGTDDLGTPFELRTLSNVLAPEGAGGECLFRNLYFTLFRANAASLQLELTPIIDNVRQQTVLGALAPPTGDPVEEVYEIPLTIPLIAGSTEQARNGMRGTWFQLEVAIIGDPEGPVEVMGLEVEYERVRETAQAVTHG